MAERITRKQIESKFAQLVAVLQMNAGYAPGSLALNSQNPGDGKRRYQIVVMEENGGESHAHFGARQWSGQEIYWQMDAMLNALTMSRRPPAGSQDNYYAGLATHPYWHHAVAESAAKWPDAKRRGDANGWNPTPWDYASHEARRFRDDVQRAITREDRNL